MISPYRYFVCADIIISGEYVGSFIKTKHLFLSNAVESCRKKMRTDFANSSMKIRYCVRSRDFFKNQPKCVNERFACGMCDRQGTCSKLTP